MAFGGVWAGGVVELVLLSLGCLKLGEWVDCDASRSSRPLARETSLCWNLFSMSGR
jgi:hypothetical protein